jgi:hypothetical protein
MDSQTLKMLTFAAAGAAALTVATDALACEQCPPDPTNTGGICWSGFDSGFNSCWGGGEDWCQFEGSCERDPVDCSTGYCDQWAWDDYMCWGYGSCS